jgi:hypothetical protein
MVLTPPAGVAHLILAIKQNGVGGFTVAGWPAAVIWSPSAPVISLGVNAKDLIALYWDGTNYWAVTSQNFI